MTESKWWDESGKLSMQLTGCAQQLPLWLQIGHDAPYDIEMELPMHENADNGNAHNKNHLYRKNVMLSQLDYACAPLQ
jgi:hypothetical protein